MLSVLLQMLLSTGEQLIDSTQVTVVGKLLTPSCLRSPRSKNGSSPLKGCGGNCRPGEKKWQPTAGLMTHVTCRLTAKNRDQLRSPTLGNIGGGAGGHSPQWRGWGHNALCPPPANSDISGNRVWATFYSSNMAGPAFYLTRGGSRVFPRSVCVGWSSKTICRWRPVVTASSCR